MTLRELVWAAEARQSAEWERIAPLIASVWNTSPHRSPKCRFWLPDDFNPFRLRARRAAEREIDTAEQLFASWGVKPPESPPCSTST